MEQNAEEDTAQNSVSQKKISGSVSGFSQGEGLNQASEIFGVERVCPPREGTGQGMEKKSG